VKQLSLDNLRTLVSVIELDGYAKAGERLGRSQPAISLQIKKLEEQLASVSGLIKTALFCINTPSSFWQLMTMYLGSLSKLR
jgi:hypothetical protein